MGVFWKYGGGFGFDFATDTKNRVGSLEVNGSATLPRRLLVRADLFFGVESQ